MANALRESDAWSREGSLMYVGTIRCAVEALDATRWLAQVPSKRPGTHVQQVGKPVICPMDLNSLIIGAQRIPSLMRIYANLEKN